MQQLDIAQADAADSDDDELMVAEDDSDAEDIARLQKLDKQQENEYESSAEEENEGEASSDEDMQEIPDSASSSGEEIDDGEESKKA